MQNKIKFNFNVCFYYELKSTTSSIYLKVKSIYGVVASALESSTRVSSAVCIACSIRDELMHSVTICAHVQI